MTIVGGHSLEKQVESRACGDGAYRTAVGDARLVVEDTAEARGAVSWLGGSGQGDLTDWLEKRDPVALAERAAAFKESRGMDHIFLARYTGTDYFQWFGRRSSGYMNPFGKLMRLSSPATPGA